MPVRLSQSWPAVTTNRRAAELLPAQGQKVKLLQSHSCLDSAAERQTCVHHTSEMGPRTRSRSNTWDEESLERIISIKRPRVCSEGPYSRSGKYVEQGKRVTYKEQGVGRVGVRAHAVKVEVKGPSTSHVTEASEAEVTGMVHAELVSVSADVGPLKTKAKGPNILSVVDESEAEVTGMVHAELVSISAKVDDVEAKVKGPNTSAGVKADQDGAAVMARAEYGSVSAKVGVVEVEAKGPSTSAGAKVGKDGAAVMTRAELYSAEVKAGPVGVKVALAADTGASVGRHGVEAKFLGTGFSIGRKSSVSFGGFELSWSF